MSWNYRVVRCVDSGGEYFCIHEVYYNPDNSIWGITEKSMGPIGDTLEELEQDIKWMLKACEKPILDRNMKFAKHKAMEKIDPGSGETKSAKEG